MTFWLSFKTRYLKLPPVIPGIFSNDRFTGSVDGVGMVGIKIFLCVSNLVAIYARIARCLF